jgi:hypothetical protein
MRELLKHLDFWGERLETEIRKPRAVAGRRPSSRLCLSFNFQRCTNNKGSLNSLWKTFKRNTSKSRR